MSSDHAKLSIDELGIGFSSGVVDGIGSLFYTPIKKKRGEHFIEDIVPRSILNQYIAEIKASRAKLAKSNSKKHGKRT